MGNHKREKGSSARQGGSGKGAAGRDAKTTAREGIAKAKGHTVGSGPNAQRDRSERAICADPACNAGFLIPSATVIKAEAGEWTLPTLCPRCRQNRDQRRQAKRDADKAWVESRPSELPDEGEMDEEQATADAAVVRAALREGMERETMRDPKRTGEVNAAEMREAQRIGQSTRERARNAYPKLVEVCDMLGQAYTNLFPAQSLILHDQMDIIRKIEKAGARVYTATAYSFLTDIRTVKYVRAVVVYGGERITVLLVVQGGHIQHGSVFPVAAPVAASMNKTLEEFRFQFAPILRVLRVLHLAAAFGAGSMHTQSVPSSILAAALKVAANICEYAAEGGRDMLAAAKIATKAFSTTRGFQKAHPTAPPTTAEENQAAMNRVVVAAEKIEMAEELKAEAAVDAAAKVGKEEAPPAAPVKEPEPVRMWVAPPTVTETPASEWVLRAPLPPIAEAPALPDTTPTHAVTEGIRYPPQILALTSAIRHRLPDANPHGVPIEPAVAIPLLAARRGDLLVQVTEPALAAAQWNALQLPAGGAHWPAVGARVNGLEWVAEAGTTQYHGRVEIADGRWEWKIGNDTILSGNDVSGKTVAQFGMFRLIRSARYPVAPVLEVDPRGHVLRYLHPTGALGWHFLRPSRSTTVNTLAQGFAVRAGLLRAETTVIPATEYSDLLNDLSRVVSPGTPQATATLARKINDRKALAHLSFQAKTALVEELFSTLVATRAATLLQTENQALRQRSLRHWGNTDASGTVDARHTAVDPIDWLPIVVVLMCCIVGVCVLGLVAIIEYAYSGTLWMACAVVAGIITLAVVGLVRALLPKIQNVEKEFVGDIYLTHAERDSLANAPEFGGVIMRTVYPAWVMPTPDALDASLRPEAEFWIREPGQQAYMVEPDRVPALLTADLPEPTERLVSQVGVVIWGGEEMGHTTQFHGGSTANALTALNKRILTRVGDEATERALRFWEEFLFAVRLEAAQYREDKPIDTATCGDERLKSSMYRQSELLEMEGNAPQGSVSLGGNRYDEAKFATVAIKVDEKNAAYNENVDATIAPGGLSGKPRIITSMHRGTERTFRATASVAQAALAVCGPSPEEGGVGVFYPLVATPGMTGTAIARLIYSRVKRGLDVRLACGDDALMVLSNPSDEVKQEADRDGSDGCGNAVAIEVDASAKDATHVEPMLRMFARYVVASALDHGFAYSEIEAWEKNFSHGMLKWVVPEKKDRARVQASTTRTLFVTGVPQLASGDYMTTLMNTLHTGAILLAAQSWDVPVKVAMQEFASIPDVQPATRALDTAAFCSLRFLELPSGAAIAVPSMGRTLHAGVLVQGSLRLDERKKRWAEYKRNIATFGVSPYDSTVQLGRPDTAPAAMVTKWSVNWAPQQITREDRQFVDRWHQRRYGLSEDEWVAFCARWAQCACGELPQSFKWSKWQSIVARDYSTVGRADVLPEIWA